MTEHLESHILSKFKVLKKIGSGAYGHVWKVIDNKDKKVKALKKNFDAFNNSTDAQRTYREIMFLMQLKHPNVVKLQQVIRADNNVDIYLVFEHMDIDLFTLVRQNILEEKHKKWILYQICKAIFYLHSAGLIHRDLKPSNILVNENCDAKLCDFGLVRSLDEQNDKDNILTEYIATRWYRAPQILVGSTYYTKAIDIWGLGCLIGQIFKGKPIFPGTSTINQMQRILAWTGNPKQTEVRSLKANGTQIIRQLCHVKKLNKKQFIPNITEQAMQLMIKCLQFSPQKRITIEEIMKHPYLKEFYSKKDLIVQKKKIRVSIDDNERLSLKQYRNIIYKEIKARDHNQQPERRESVDKTLYRIREASTKKHIASMETQKSQKFSKLETIENFSHKGTIPSKKNSQNLLNTYNNQTSINKNINSLSAPKPNNSSSLVRKKIHSINSNNFRQKSMILTEQQSLKSSSKPSGNKNLKTMESEWNPINTKKAVDFREEMRKTKNILTNTLLTKPKRSLYEMQTKKVKRTILSSQIEHSQKPTGLAKFL